MQQKPVIESELKFAKGSKAFPENCGISLELVGTYPAGDITEISMTVDTILTIFKENALKFSPKNGSTNLCEYSFYPTKRGIGDYIDNNQLSMKIDFLNLKQSGIDIPIKNLEERRFVEPKSVPEFCDTIIHVIETEEDSDFSDMHSGDYETPRSRFTFKSRKAILSKASPWFHNLFFLGMKESRDSEVSIRGIHPDTFQRLLNFIYGFELEINGINDAVKLIKAADRIHLTKALEFIFVYLNMRVNNKTVLRIWKAGDDFECKETMEYCKSYTKKHWESILADPSWLETDGRDTIQILSIDSLPLAADESIFYQAVLNWREAKIKQAVDVPEMLQSNVLQIFNHLRNNRFTKDCKLWSNEIGNELEDVENHFVQMIPLIRFNQLTAKYLMDNVETSGIVIDIPGMKKKVLEAFRAIAIRTEIPETVNTDKRHI
ncbi:hypothetical protein F4703DRAFT_1967899 [Phycomyces blakesleeanus]